MHRNELTSVDFLTRSAAVFPDRVAVVHGARRSSYEMLRQRVCRLGSALWLGLATHDRLAILSPNTPAMLEARFAVPAAGGVLVAIDVRLGAAEIGGILSHCGAGCLIVDRQLDAQLGSVDLAGPHVSSESTMRASRTTPTRRSSPRARRSRSRVGSPTRRSRSRSTTHSGTTGRPKGVVHTHRGAYLNALGEVIETGLGFESNYLWTLPMFHGNGRCFPWTETAVGGTHVRLRGVDPDLNWDLPAAEG